MGSCCSVTLQVQCDALINRCLDCTFGRASYLCSMEENLKSITNALEELKALKNDVEHKVDSAEAQEQKRLDQVQWWMSRVEEIQVEVDELLRDKDQELQKLCAGGCCSSSCKSSYEYGEKVTKKLREVNALKGRTFDVVAGKAPPLPEVRQTEKPEGMESMIDELWNQLEEPEVRIVGLYGMGGVGKTTLLDHIYNKYLDTPNDFDFIIWIPISKNHRIEKIQNEIGSKIGCSSDKWKNKEERQKAQDIFWALRKKKFMLLLDDVWEWVDLKKVGIPIPDETNLSKLIFTTRDEHVCSKMGGRKSRVKCLEEEEAWKLFGENVNVAEDVLSLDPEIPDLARIVAKKCAGLPLALIIVGRAMSCKKTAREWRDAIDVLRRSASKFEGMEEVLLPLLKLSYDNLSSDEVKACFLYCALFPEDFAIHKDELIYKWMGEEILKEYADVDGALNKGYTIIGTLVRSCLLEDLRGHVKMHDVIRDMAVWLACELQETRDNFMVQAGHLLTEIPNVDKWEGVKRMSLMANDIENLETIPSCPNLHTLFLSNNRLKMVAQNFFNSMSTLRVLDLSKNKDLAQLPSGISKLVSLVYLDLSETCIAALPIELKALVKLIYLNLEHTSELDVIPHNLLSSFSKLRVLRLYNSGTCKSILGDNAHPESELQGLKHLDMLTFTIQTVLISERFFASDKLLSCTRFLCLDGLSFLDISPLASMKRAYSLTINSCGVEYNLNVLSQSSFNHLEAVDVHDCPNLSDLTWLVFAPNLKTLSIRSCSNMKEIIRLEKLGEIAQVDEMNQFSKLDELILVSLPQLESIYGNKTLPFLYLKRIETRGCQNLKKLPLNLSSIPKRDLVITGEEEWWNMLDWENKDVEEAFRPCFRQYK